MEKRVFYNPKIKDKVTVLKTADETNGDHILVEVELAPGGGTPRHYHTTFNETFFAVEGVLGVELKGKKLLLKNGESATASMKQVHRFYNPGTSIIRFQVKISPAQSRFLECFAIGYGLAADGKANDKGLPKNIDHLSLVLEHSDTRFTGFLSLIQPFLLRRAKRARKKGVMNELMDRYCRNQ